PWEGGLWGGEGLGLRRSGSGASSRELLSFAHRVYTGARRRVPWKGLARDRRAGGAHERLLEVLDQIVRRLETDRQSDEVLWRRERGLRRRGVGHSCRH